MQAYNNISRIFRTVFRAARWVAIALLGVAIISLLLFQVPGVQNWVAQRVVHGIKAKLQTEVSLERVRILFFNSIRIEGFYLEDQQGDTLLYARDFKVNFNPFELLRRNAIVSKIEADGAVGHVKRQADSSYNFDFIIEAFAPDRPEAATQSDWNISLNTIAVNNSRVRFDDALTPQRMDLSLAKGAVKFDKFDQREKVIELDRITLSNMSLAIEQGAQAADSLVEVVEIADVAEVIEVIIEEEAQRLNPQGWQVSLKTLTIDDSGFRLTREGKPVGPEGSVDFNNLALSALNVKLKDVLIEQDTITAQVKELSLHEKSGFEIESLTGDLRFTPVGATMADFHLVTPYSELRDSLALMYDGLDAFRNVQQEVSVYFDARNSVLSSTDLVYLSPKSPYALGSNIRISGIFSGKVSSLRGKNIVIDYGNHTHFVGSIYTDGLPIVEETYIELTIDTMTSTRAELMAMIPNLKIPPAADKLGVMHFTGSFNGFINDFVAYGKLNSALGYVESDINMKVSEGKVPSYSGNISLRGFDIGRWLGEEPTLGRITMAGKVNGVGFGKDLTMNMEGTVSSLEFNGYNYRNIEAKGQLQQRFFDGQVYVKDPNLSMNFLGTVNFQEREPVFDLKADITHANLQGLNFSEDYLAVKTRINFDFRGIHPDSINGTAVFIRPVIMTDDNVYNLDTVRFASVVRSTDRELTLSSDVLNASMSGNFQFGSLPVSVMQFVNRHYAIFPDSVRVVDPQVVKFSATVKKTHKLTRLINKSLTGLDGTTVSGDFNSGTNDLNMTVSVPSGSIAGVTLYGADLVIRTEGEALVASGNIDTAMLSDGVDYTGIIFSSRLYDGKASFDLAAGSDEVVDMIEIVGRGETYADSLIMRFTGSRVALRGRPWIFAGASELVIEREGLSLRDFRASHGDQELVINTSRDRAHLTVDLTQVDVNDLVTVLNYDDYAMTGRLTGRVQIREYRSGSKIFVKANVTGSNMTFEGQDLGALEVTGTYDALMKTLLVDAVVTGDQNSAVVTGYYSHAGSRESVQMDIDMTSTPLVVFQPFLESVFSDMTGTVTAKVDLTGSPDGLVMNGNARLTNGSLRVDYIGTVYSFTDLPITFDEHTIGIDGELQDKNGTKAGISGGLAFTSLQNMRFTDFKIVTEPGFLLMETTSRDNPDFYGTAYGKADLLLNGRFTALDMVIKIRSNKNTKISLPIVTGSGYRRNNFVRFRTTEPQQEYYTATSSSLNLRLEMEVTRDAEIEIIFDERAGDIIRARGEGAIVMEVSRTGDITMFGTYSISEGEYKFTLRDIVNKSFVLRSGSRIRFTGDPYEARMEIKAAYPTKGVAYDLLGDAAGLDGKTPVDVNVLLYLGGTLEEPTLRFDIEQVGGGSGGSIGPLGAKLRAMRSDTAEMNKQAFALLVLNRFVPSDFGAEAGGVNVGKGAISNMTEFLTSQLSRYFNDWLAKYNAQLDFSYSSYDANDPTDLEKSYSRSELEIEFQKKLGRVTLNVDGTFEFGAQTGVERENPFAGDFQVEYSLTEDGRIRLVAFRRSDYDAFNTSASSTIYKTGGGVFYRREFDTWKEFFKGED